MVFPGPVLYPQADTQPRVDLRRRTARPRRIRPAGAGLGRAALLGDHETGWLQPRPPGYRSGNLPGLLPVHLHSAGIFQMRAPIILFPLWFGLWIDRKSTRLNSSHLGISYAVFCLKKN